MQNTGDSCIVIYWLYYFPYKQLQTFFSPPYIYNGISFSNKKEWNLTTCNNTDGPGEHYAKWNKSGRETQIPYDFTYMWNLKTQTKWINQTKQKQTHRYREQAHGGRKKGRRKKSNCTALTIREPCYIYIRAATIGASSTFPFVFMHLCPPLP